MRIAFVTPEFVTEETCFDGGLANYLFRIALGLKKAGHEPIIFVRSNRDEILTHCGIEVHRVRISFWFINALQRLLFNRMTWITEAGRWLLQSWLLTRSLERAHRRNPIQIVQYSSYTGTGFFRSNVLPCVVRISSYHPLLAEAIGLSRNSLQVKALAAIECKALKRGDGIFGPSRMLAKVINRELGLSVRIIESPFVESPYQMDDSFFKKFELDKFNYLLYFGSIALHKGVKVIAECLHELFTNRNNLIFVFVGKDTPYQQRTMMDYVRLNAGEYADRIIHLDKLQHNALFPIIQHAKAVILPSLIDNFPNTCIEAMSCGKIVVGTRGTSFEQLIDDGENGLLCNPNDAVGLLRAIYTALDLPKGEMQRMGRAAKRRVEKLHPEVIVGQLILFYEQIISESNKKRMI